MFIFTNVTNETVTHILIHVDDMDIVADSESYHVPTTPGWDVGMIKN